MLKRIVSNVILVLLVTSILVLAVKIPLVDAIEIVYIRADGSIDPLTAPVSTLDNVTYTLTGNITSSSDGIIVERDNIIIDGDQYTVWGPHDRSMDRSTYGINVNGRTNVTIKNTIISNFTDGIEAVDTNEATISGNNIKANDIFGIYLGSSSSDNNISGNTVKDNEWGIYLYASSDNSISRNNIANNMDGIALLDSPNNSISVNSLTANNDTGVRLSNSSYNSISVNNITANNDDGIYLDSSSNSTISGNNVTSNGYGIRLVSTSNNNNVGANNVINNFEGIWLLYSLNNSVSENSVTANNGYGIYLGSSSNNSVSGNNVASNARGIDLYYSSNNNNVSRNNVTNNSEGIWLYYSLNNSVSENNVAGNNVYGIWLYSSLNNSVSGNNVTNNVHGGIWLYSSSNNKFCHSNFVNNTPQVYSNNSTNIWNDAYPSGGNYWSDYTGTDVFQGPFQNETGGDGIGDAPYTVDTNNLDNYPLTNPWTPPDIAVIDLTSAKTIIGQGYTGSVTVTFENLGNKIETFNYTVYANSTTIHSEQIMLAITNYTVSFKWNTTGFAYGSYTLNAFVEPLQNENNTSNNVYAAREETKISIPDDINGDFRVSIVDLVILANAYGSHCPNYHYQGEPASPNWNPNADVNDDGVVNLPDLVVMAIHYGQHYP